MSNDSLDFVPLIHSVNSIVFVVILIKLKPNQMNFVLSFGRGIYLFIYSFYLFIYLFIEQKLQYCT